MSAVVQRPLDVLKQFLENTPKCNRQLEHYVTKQVFYTCDGTYKFIKRVKDGRAYFSIHCDKCYANPGIEITGIPTNPMKKIYYHYFEKKPDFMQVTEEQKNEFYSKCMNHLNNQRNKYDSTIRDLKIYNPVLSKGIKKEVYYSYLQTPAWKEKREAVFKRDNYKCQACYKNKATEVHHKTYTNLFNEPLFDLVSICRQCHEVVKHESGGLQSHVDDYDKMKNIVVSVLFHLTQYEAAHIDDVVETLEYFEEFHQAHKKWIENMVKETCKFSQGLFFEKSGYIEKKYLDVI